MFSHATESLCTALFNSACSLWVAIPPLRNLYATAASRCHSSTQLLWRCSPSSSLCKAAVLNQWGPVENPVPVWLVENCAVQWHGRWVVLRRQGRGRGHGMQKGATLANSIGGGGGVGRASTESARRG